LKFCKRKNGNAGQNNAARFLPRKNSMPSKLRCCFYLPKVRERIAVLLPSA